MSKGATERETLRNGRPARFSAAGWGLMMTQTFPWDHLTLRHDVKRLTYEARKE